jgi:hypothetical protein
MCLLFFINLVETRDCASCSAYLYATKLKVQLDAHVYAQLDAHVHTQLDAQSRVSTISWLLVLIILHPKISHLNLNPQNPSNSDTHFFPQRRL